MSALAAPDWSYPICTVQRSGSQFFCELLRGIGLAGAPPGHDLCKACWDDEWTPEQFATNVGHSLREATGRNGISGSRMFWNAWELFLERSRAWHRLHDAGDVEVLKTVFRELQYVWLRRLEKLRQAIFLLEGNDGRGSVQVSCPWLTRERT